MEDFDIYGDLEHIESEAKKESLELRALQCRIKELQEIVNAAEQEKQDIIKKNDILLENVSSLLLTAKAELKRKDTVISDLRKQCDNVVFRRGNQADTRKKCVTKFTQTPVRHVVHTAIQTVPAEENDPFWRKSRHAVDMELDRYREHDRERERDGKNVRDPRRIRDRDKADDKERVRQRDEERNRDRDRERNRDQYRSQHRTQYRDQNRRNEYPSYERSRDREVHSSSQRKDSKSSKDRPLKQDRNEAHSSGHTSSNEADQLKNQNRRTFDKKTERLLTNSQTPCLQQDGKNDNVIENISANNQSTQEIECNRQLSGSTKKELRTLDKPVACIRTDQSQEKESGNKLVSTDDFTIPSIVPSSTCLSASGSKMDVGGSNETSAIGPEDFSSFKESTNKQSVHQSASTDSGVRMAEEIKDKTELKLSGKNTSTKKRKNNEASINKTAIALSDDNEKSNRTITDPTSLNYLKSPELNVSSCNTKGLLHNEKNDILRREVGDGNAETVTKNPIESDKKMNTRRNSSKTTAIAEQALEAVVSKVKPRIDKPVDVKAILIQSVLEKLPKSLAITKISPSTSSNSAIKEASVTEKRKSNENGHLPSGVNATVSNEMCDFSKSNMPEDKKSNAIEADNNDNLPNSETKIPNTDVTNQLRVNPRTDTHENSSQITSESKSASNGFVSRQLLDNPDNVVVISMQPVSAEEAETIDAFKNDTIPSTNVKDTSQQIISKNLTCNSGLKLHHAPKKVEFALEVKDSVADATNSKQTLASNPNVFPMDNNTRPALRARRAKSCFFEPESSENQLSETITLQSFFSTFEVTDVIVEQKDTTCLEASTANSLLTVGENSSTVGLNSMADSNLEQVNDIDIETKTVINSKPKLSTAENIRERLRKRQNVNSPNAPVRRVLPLVNQQPKRRLSADSANISSKKHKSDIDIRAGTNKLLTSPTAGNLSTSYFSQIALPITSALDSIPSKLQSPISKRTLESVNTPMVVVHSPAKASDQTKLYNNSGGCCYPSDDYSSLEHIMDSLFRTPIKNEPPSDASVSPSAGDFVTNDAEQNVPSTEYLSSDHLLAHSTPLSSKPLPRLNKNDSTANVCKSVVEKDEKCPPIPLRAGTLKCVLTGGSENVDKKRKDCRKISGPTGTAEPIGKGKGTVCPKTRPVSNNELDIRSTNRASKLLNEYNDNETPLSVATVQQPIKSSNACYKSFEDVSSCIAPSSKVFKTPAAITLNASFNQLNPMEMQREVKVDRNGMLTEMDHPKKSPKASLPIAKSVKEQIAQNASKPRKDSMPMKIPSLLNSKNATRKISENKIKQNTDNSENISSQKPIAPRKRSRKQTNDDEKEMTDRISKQESKQLKKSQETSNVINNTNQTGANSHDTRDPCCSKSSYESEIAVDHNLKEKSPLLLNNEYSEKINPQTNRQPVSNDGVSRVSVPDMGNALPVNMDASKAEQSAQPILSSFALNLSLAANDLNNAQQSVQKREAARTPPPPPPAPVRYVREMRIVKESPSLMRVFIRRK